MSETIFDLSLSDEYILNLEFDDLITLVTEAEQFILTCDRSIAKLIWGSEEHESELPPRLYNWEPVLYQTEIEAIPDFQDRLEKARRISFDAGVAEGIKSTAFLKATEQMESENEGSF